MTRCEEFVAYLHDELDRTNEEGEELQDQVCERYLSVIMSKLKRSEWHA